MDLGGNPPHTKKSQLIFLEENISKPNIVLFDDRDYKEQELLELNRWSGFTYSLTDSVIRKNT